MKSLGRQLFPHLGDSTHVAISSSVGLDVPMSTLRGNPRIDDTVASIELAGLLGVEPRQRVSETRVLPLHHNPT